jgi:membrane-associated phospholipid phosphatase
MTKVTWTRAWPSRECLVAFLANGLWLSLLWIVIYGGTSWLTGLHGYRVRLGFEAEKAIPFIPEAALVYLSLFPMIWLSLFILPTPYEIRRFAKALAWLYVISGIGFILLPGEQAYSLPAVHEAINPVFEFADWINLEYNYLPSLHVGLAVACAYAYSERLSLGRTLLMWTWAAAISASTLLTRQHYLADVIAGAAVGWLIAYKCLSGRDILTEAPS